MRLTISNQKGNLMQVGIDGFFYEELDGTELAENIHAVQWYETYGEVEYKDPATDKMTHNEEIDSISDFQFAIDAWHVVNNLVVLEEAKSQAFNSAYEKAIADGESEEDALAAGKAASDAVTDAPE